MEEELFEPEAGAGFVEVVDFSWEVDGFQGVSEAGQAAAGAEAGGKPLDGVLGDRDRLFGPLAEFGGTEGLGGGMPWDQGRRAAGPGGGLFGDPCAGCSGSPAPSPPAEDASLTNSHSRTAKPRADRLPVRRSWVPGMSFEATQGWLNQVARTWPVASPTLTLTMRRRPLRKGRGCLPWTSTWTVAVSPGVTSPSSLMRRSRWRLGMWKRRSPMVRRPASAAASAVLGPMPLRAPRPWSRTLGRGQWTGASSSSARPSSRALPKARTTGRPAATTSSAVPPRGSRPRPRRACGCRARRAGSGRPRRRSG